MSVRESGLTLRSSDKWSPAERRIITIVDQHYQFPKDDDALYSIHQISRADGTLTDTWSAMVYPVIERLGNDTFSSPGFRQVFIAEDDRVIVLKELDYREDGELVHVVVTE